MKISEQWLSEWVTLPADTQQLAEQLTMAGLEVDSVAPAAPPFSEVVVGEIMSADPHPDAERLKVCQVSDGGESLYTVVCGAPNALSGLKVPFARVGARLPGDIKIKAAKLRGVKSFGMLCSGKELGLSDESAGLMPLPADAPVGEDFRAWLGLDDAVIEIELTPNRSDCLSIAGVAREVGVLGDVDARQPQANAIEPVSDAVPSVHLASPADCPRYCARIIHNVDTTAPTPMWLQERLRRAGVRPLSIAVDVTNYVMLELGQPMHAFDAKALNGGVTVRRAHAGEQLTLLNGDTVRLQDNTLVIADEQVAVAMAGVMGGADCAVGDTTESILLESAFFAPSAIAGRARQYGLHTDASHRFERGVDPELCHIALERASALLIDAAGGQAGGVVEACETAHLPARPSVSVRPDRVNQLLGTAIDPNQMRSILTRLGMPPSEQGEVWQVSPPSWRFDIHREVDLIEEIARIYGYNQLPSRRTSAPAAVPRQSERHLTNQRVRALLVDRGYHEALTYSFVSDTLQSQLDPESTPLALANPLSADLAVMRTTLWTGLVRALAYNRNRQIKRVRLFETGLRFRGSIDELTQTSVIAGVAAGPASDERWANDQRTVDFFDVKGDVEALFALAGPGLELEFNAQAHPALHPGQSAQISLAGQAIGWLGALHPSVLRALDLDGPVYVFEIERRAFDERALPAFSALSRFPSIRRDLAVVVDEAVSAQAVSDCITQTAGEHLEWVALFDVYRGRGVRDGCKSLAIGLILQDNTRTLTDEEVDAVQQRVVARLREALGAELRE